MLLQETQYIITQLRVILLYIFLTKTISSADGKVNQSLAAKVKRTYDP